MSMGSIRKFQTKSGHFLSIRIASSMLRKWQGAELSVSFEELEDVTVLSILCERKTRVLIPFDEISRVIASATFFAFRADAVGDSTFAESLWRIVRIAQKFVDPGLSFVSRAKVTARRVGKTCSKRA